MVASSVVAGASVAASVAAGACVSFGASDELPHAMIDIDIAATIIATVIFFFMFPLLPFFYISGIAPDCSGVPEYSNIILLALPLQQAF